MDSNVGKKLELNRKLKEYEIKITKMAGYLADYYLDRAIESEDFSIISSYLIDYFSGTIGRNFDVGYLVSKYKEYGLNEKVEDMNFNINDWYKMKYELDSLSNIETEKEHIIKMNEDEYVQYMINKRKKEMD